MRLIDADELKEQLKELYELCVHVKEPFTVEMVAYHKMDGMIEMCLDTIRKLNCMPEIDAVPVVRCKDCKWYEKKGKTTGYCSLLKPAVFICLDNWYCKDGERKNEIKEFSDLDDLSED